VKNQFLLSSSPPPLEVWRMQPFEGARVPTMTWLTLRFQGFLIVFETRTSPDESLMQKISQHHELPRHLSFFPSQLRPSSFSTFEMIRYFPVLIEDEFDPPSTDGCVPNIRFLPLQFSDGPFPMSKKQCQRRTATTQIICDKPRSYPLHQIKQNTQVFKIISEKPRIIRNILFPSLSLLLNSSFRPHTAFWILKITHNQILDKR